MRRIVTYLAALACASVLTTLPAGAVGLDFQLQPPGGPTSKTSYGFVSGVSLGGVSLTNDTTVAAPPFTGLPATPAAGIVSKFAWNGGVGDPVHTTFTGSPSTAAKIKAYLTTRSSTLMAEHVTIYSYNEIKKLWYVAFDCTINGALAKEVNVALSVEGDIVASVIQPQSTSVCTINNGNGTMLKSLGVTVKP
jgi:hypothetical protein